MLEKGLEGLTHLTRIARVLHATGVEKHLVGRKAGSEIFLNREQLLTRYDEKITQIPVTIDEQNIVISPADARSLEATSSILSPTEPLSRKDAAIVALANFAYILPLQKDESPDSRLDYKKKGHFHLVRRGQVKRMRDQAKDLIDKVVGGYMVNTELRALSEFNKHQQALDPRTAIKQGLAAVAQIAIPMVWRIPGGLGAAASVLAGHVGADLVKGRFGEKIIKRDGSEYEEAHKPVDVTRQAKELLQVILNMAKLANIPGVDKKILKNIRPDNANDIGFFVEALFVQHPHYLLLRQRASAYELLTRDEVATARAMKEESATADDQADRLLADAASPDTTIDTPDTE